MKKISFSEEDIQKCKEFSENADTTFYAKRNQFDNNKRCLDSQIGKIGELVAYYNLLEKYSDISYPDFKIYKARQKSWDYDLKSSDNNCHIKTQNYVQSIRYGMSWIFQNQDKHIFKEYKDNDYIVFVSVNLLEKTGEIKKILPVKLLHEKQLFKKPVLAKLFDKSAVYFDDIKELENHLLCQ